MRFAARRYSPESAGEQLPLFQVLIFTSSVRRFAGCHAFADLAGWARGNVAAFP